MNKLLKKYRSLFKQETATIPTFSYTINISSTSYSLPLNTTIPDTMIVEWGDGSSGSFANTTSVSHIYPSTGTYQIKIRHSEGLNKMPYFKFYNKNDLISLDSPMLTVYGNNTVFNNFDKCFLHCVYLTAINKDLFKNNSSITYFTDCFKNCIRLTTIPEGLFDNNINSNSFAGCFKSCTGLTSIPEGLFDNNINSNRFAGCFEGCTGLTTIPEGLFDNNINVTNFGACFDSCWALTTIPENLFRYNTLVTDFSSCFYNCVKLQLKSNIFCNEATEKGTRFLNKTPNFAQCFYIQSSFTGTKGTAPQLWNYTYGGTPTSTKCFNSSYMGNQITNAADVPVAWKG